VKEYLKDKKDIICDHGELAMTDMYKEKTYRNRGCVDLSVRLVIHSNNTVPICCSDFSHEIVFGNVKESSLKEIWDCRKLTRMRTF
jgi:MoaA/NifB/PqqE/SkfB family radical SAM enzyme